MATTNNLKSLLVAVLLIVAGLISPSNGLDDRIYKTPMESLKIMLAVIFAGTVAVIILNFIKNNKESKSHTKTKI